MKRTLTLATMITLGAAAWMPLPSMAQIGLNLVINSAPPAPRFETVPAARHGYVWAPGYWNWDGRRHAWLAGHWENARDGYQYQGSEWQRDGVPNRRDHDRDGDGVRNHRDDRPDNPRRN